MNVNDASPTSAFEEKAVEVMKEAAAQLNRIPGVEAEVQKEYGGVLSVVTTNLQSAAKAEAVLKGYVISPKLKKARGFPGIKQIHMQINL